MDTLLNLIKESVSPLFSALWGSLVFWRTAALALLIPPLLAFLKRDLLLSFLLSSEIREHDRMVFEKANAILSEEALYRQLDRLASDHAYFQVERRQLSDFMQFFKIVGNWYQTRRVARATKDLVKVIDKYMAFKAVHFFRHPEDQQGDNIRLVLEPRLNIDREGTGRAEEMREYAELAGQLRKHIDEIDAAYKSYRLTVLKSLGV